MTARLAAKHVLVTGAATGIGRAVAEACAREGATVALLDLDGDSVERLAEELRGEGHHAQALVADIADRTAVEAAVARVREINGPLTTLAIMPE
ncbi:SDR family NAD(P)-dependent oxidoreductase [Halomonas sp. QHL1]|uniref:SDR family NAD(P)-dependent oxidoreductase n=1 Tax=Halomonas sp. QHL1 TaxID=1123773 RepID=UPI000ACF0BB9|nr:SDR family NAD(P)-dependent oxidoreductase [Halomonas sp. QHL1]